MSDLKLQPPFRHGGEKQWFADLPSGFPTPTDTSEAPAQSTLILREDGRPLGPRHAIHAEIQSRGGGRYSHWNGGLWFSTSDDSDPNNNGRRYSVAVGASTPRVLGLGTCHLHGALAQLRAQGRVHDVWPNPLLSYSPREAVQLIEFHRGSRNIPDWLRVLTPVTMWDWPTDFVEADIVLLEFGASIDIAYREYWMPRVCISEALLEPISSLGRTGWRAARRWFHLGLMMQNEKVRVECVEQMVDLIPQIDGDQKLARDIVENARGNSQAPSEVTSTMARVVELLDPDAVCVMSAQNAFAEDGRPVTWPGNFPQHLDAMCQRLSLPLLHSAQLVAKYGTRFSLLSDRHHFTPQFLSVLGEEMLAMSRRPPEEIPLHTHIGSNSSRGRRRNNETAN